MALIDCPECNNKVSTEAELCPHCGFNIKRIISYCPICEDDNENILMNYDRTNNRLSCPKCGWNCGLSTPTQEAQWAEQRRIEALQNANKVTCPYCHSTNTKKITVGSKAVHTAVFGLWSMGRNSKNYHCNGCGSDF